ncbi:MAG TPA: thioredoxin domain-containing protein [Planctomycetota bacterium]|nr:thioredoxin domain-containing protein [Planctomycetota bacterium]
MSHAPASRPDDGPLNRLAAEKSPYLLQHARNPVDWHAWNPETLEKAKREDKPIFLSIGYSTCHWCHVMEHESFEDAATARALNELFVNVKVDREERPDVDQIYMQAVMALHGQGGWPLSVWLTPDLKPFYGGTYFPKEPRYGRPGFVDLCRTLHDLFRKRRQDVEQQAEQAATWLSRRGGRGVAASAGNVETLPDAAVRGLLNEFDSEHGGFGDAPKFPRPSTLFLLAHEVARRDHVGARRALETTLDHMWRGGIYDHVGGGFARYSVDARWLVPHFEKMLYDNAQLIEAYLDGAGLLGRSDFAVVAKDVAAWTAREMTSPQGGFYSAQDADSEGEEGKFYVFTPDELREALGADADRAIRLFAATALGNFEGANILHWPRPIAETAAEENLAEAELRRWWATARKKLYAWREKRVRPGLDDKTLASWNGMMIGALARLGAWTQDASILGAARAAAEFAWRELWRPESRTLLRRWREGDARYDGSLDDYAFLALGYVALFSADGDPEWLERAETLRARADALFADPEGGYFFAAPSPDLVARMKEVYDGAMPSANSAMALLGARLGAVRIDEELRMKSLDVARAFADEVLRIPHGYPFLAAAVLEAAEPPRQLFVVGAADDAAFRDLLSRAHRAPMPGRVIIPVTDSRRAALEKLGVPLHGKSPAADGSPVAYLCEELSCREWP